MNVSYGWRHAILTKPAAAALSGPIFAGATYPDLLVAAACSSGDDLKLVLYPGGAAGEQRLGIERLQPGKHYLIRQSGRSFIADSHGKAEFDHRIDARTEIQIVLSE